MTRVVIRGLATLLVRAALAVALAALVTSGCRPHADPAAVEAERTQRDKEALTLPLGEDHALDLVLRSADRLSESGDEEKAAALLESDGQAAADRATQAIDAVTPESAWGKTVTAELAEVVHARKTAIASYIAALRGTDIDAKLVAIQEQLSLEQRTMAVLAHVNGELEGWTPPAAITATTAGHAPPPTLTEASTSPHP